MAAPTHEPWVRVESRPSGLPTVHAAGVAFHLTGHAVKRCEEMGLALDYIVDALTLGQRQRNSPRSVHYKGGRGWLARWRDLSVGMVENNPSDFTITTVLWREENLWDEWFKRQPATTRQYRPTTG